MSSENELIRETFSRQTFHYAPIGMAVLSASGRLLKVNPALCRLLGYSESELEAKTFKDISHPEDLPKDVSPITLFFESKLDVYETEKRYLHKNGREIWAMLAVTPVKDETNTPIYLVAHIVDLTQKKLAEADLIEQQRLLQEKELLYQSIADNSFDFITRHDLDGTFREVSASCHQVLGYTKQEMVGQPAFAFLHPDEMQHIREQCKSLFHTSYKLVITHRFRRKDGCYLWIESTLIAIPEEETGGVKEFVIVSRDINERIETFEQLKESQRKYRMIADNAREIITFTNPQGKIQYISPAVTPLLGYGEDEVVGTSIFDYWHPAERRVKQSSELSGSWSSSTPYSRLRHKDGGYVQIETTFQPIHSETGDIVQVLCISRDITKRKQAEDELRMTKEKLESFISNHADAVWMVDRDGYVQQVNAAFQRLFQWSPAETLSFQLPVILSQEQKRVDELRTKVLSGGSVVGYESVWQRKDGSLVEVSTTLFPIRDSSGRITGLAGTTQDISEKKNAERKLKASKEQFKAYLEQNIDPVLILDMHYRVIRVNPAFESTFGWSIDEIVGTRVFDLPSVPLDTPHRLGPTFEKMEPQSIEIVKQKKDGTLIPVLISIFRLLDEAGTHNGWALNLRDMTAYKQAEQLLINSEKLSVAGQLAAGIAHEIRNPITAIKGFIQLMSSGIAEKQLYYEIMASEIERIEMILNELLILAKPQAVQTRPSDVRLLLNQVVTLLDSQANMNNVQIITGFDTGPAWILCDENQIKQVCINLIKNAIEALPGGGILQIHLGHQEHDRLIVRFTDNGIGIPEAVLNRLGQPFYTTKEKGTGLGFMVSKKIIESHNGTITIRSKENEGTTIELNLPGLPAFHGSLSPSRSEVEVLGGVQD
ncbi:hypothetical protein AWM70_16025 [Paenibacillus yonginensis]|uniref:histidine kinase n=1 Tax=Paenibacillus yonginensis TaxID=1462996 RepID=A0A1B1N3C4_9BACL|nr:PAS domain S-box protein [Paenibacillus yonginensis]ANS75906.1 hypothetical protein AWM70_16025 [Paenibacillus yonginensis]